MDSHLRAKRRDLLRKLFTRLGAKKISPLRQRQARGFIELPDLLRAHALRQQYRRELRVIKNLI